MLEKSDLLDMIHLDETSFGANRHGVYEALFRYLHAGAVLRDESGNVTGFALSVEEGQPACYWICDCTKRGGGHRPSSKPVFRLEGASVDRCSE